MFKMDQEKTFKLIIFLLLALFSVTMIGFFLLGVKIALIFTPEVKLAGMSIKNIIAGVAR